MFRPMPATLFFTPSYDPGAKLAVDVDFSVPLQALLPSICRRFGVRDVDFGGLALAVAPQTRTYSTGAPPGVERAKAVVGGGGSGGVRVAGCFVGADVRAPAKAAGRPPAAWLILAASRARRGLGRRQGWIWPDRHISIDWCHRR